MLSTETQIVKRDVIQEFIYNLNNIYMYLEASKGSRLYFILLKKKILRLSFQLNAIQWTRNKLLLAFVRVIASQVMSDFDRAGP